MGAALAAGLLQATSLPFLVTVTQIGVGLDEMSPDTAAVLVTAGLLSVVIFPLAAVSLLGGREAEESVTPASTRDCTCELDPEGGRHGRC